MNNSSIAWTNDTWNPWHGCTKVSPGCLNCYMYRDKKKYGQNPFKIVRSAKATFTSPLRGKGPLVFTCSWSDFFIKEADPWRQEAWEIIRMSKHLTFQILTKRPERIMASLPPDWGAGYPNVWLGVSIEKNVYKGRMYWLNKVPCRLRFISAEPLLERVDFSDLKGFDWLITGGESGPGFRPADPEWFLSIQKQCKEQGVAYFHKQNGGDHKVGEVWGGSAINGKMYKEFPANK